MPGRLPRSIRELPPRIRTVPRVHSRGPFSIRVFSILRSGFGVCPCIENAMPADVCKSIPRFSFFRFAQKDGSPRRCPVIVNTLCPPRGVERGGGRNCAEMAKFRRWAYLLCICPNAFQKRHGGHGSAKRASFPHSFCGSSHLRLDAGVTPVANRHQIRQIIGPRIPSAFNQSDDVMDLPGSLGQSSPAMLVEWILANRVHRKFHLADTLPFLRRSKVCRGHQFDRVSPGVFFVSHSLCLHCFIDRSRMSIAIRIAVDQSGTSRVFAWGAHVVILSQHRSASMLGWGCNGCNAGCNAICYTLKC